MSGVHFLGPQRTIPQAADGTRETLTHDRESLDQLRRLEQLLLQQSLLLRRMERFAEGPCDYFAQATIALTANKVLTLLNANPIRRRFTIFNTTGSVAYVFCGTGASSTRLTMELPAKGYFEDSIRWRGIVTALSAGTCTLSVTEYW